MMQQRAMTVEDMANKLKPLFGKKIDELYFRYSVANSLEERNEIFQILTSLYQKHLYKLLDKQVLLSPPKEELVSGTYPLAKVTYAGKELYDFSLREKDWPRHICVSGMSGSGKTTFAINILKEFIKKDKPFLVFDWKSSFRPLTGIDNSLMTFTVGNDAVSNLFKVNINRPPKGVHPKEWINTLTDLITESFSASFGVHKIILETLDEIFEGWGVYNGSNHYPNWQHVKRMLESKSREAKGRETGWYESAMRIASVMTFGTFGKVVNYDGKRSLSIEDLFDKRVVLEMNSLSTIEKKFFAEYILTYIYRLKKANPNEIDSGFKHAILVDEAHNVFLKKPTNFMSESVTDMIYREMREYGTGLICLDQHVSKLSDTVTGNSACHIAFQQQLPADIEAISGLMQMRDKRENFSELSVGTAVVKLSERYTQPFLVKVPFTDLRQHVVSDDDIRTRVKALVEGFDVVKKDKEFVEAIQKSPLEKPVKLVDTDQSQHPVAVVVEENKEKEYTYKLPISGEIARENHKFENIKFVETPSLAVTQKAQIVKVNDDSLTYTQQVLFDFAKTKSDEGMSLTQIESLLDQGLHEKCYNVNDVMKAMNKVFELQFRKSEAPLEKEKIESFLDKEAEVIEVKDEQKFTLKVVREGLSEEESNFLNFLESNPNHENTTVALYKLVGLSPRKGNVVKNNLMEKGLIKVEEEKYEKGWKKYIRLN